MAKNITEIRLLSVPLENDYKHTLYFGDAAAQAAYFKGKTVHSGDDFSYQRKEGYIRYSKHFDDLQNCNYIMYKNSAYSTKWYYAFITKMEYKGDETTWIYFETDVIQTYLFDYNVKASFVEREHVDDDTGGLHILDEGLQLGEYVCNLHNQATFGGDSFYIVIGVSKVYARAKGEWAGIEVTEDDFYQCFGNRYHNLYSGLAYRAFPYTSEGISKLNDLIVFYDEKGHGEDIQVMFLAPASLINFQSTPESVLDTYGGWVANSSKPQTTFINKVEGEDYKLITLQTNDIDGYTPRNKKLFAYPYRYLLVTNNNGVSVPYLYEEFTHPEEGWKYQPVFQIEGCLSPGCSVRMVPRFYKGVDRNDEEGINLGKFPSLNWTSDLYTNWLTQNAVNIGVDLVTGVVTTVGGVVSAVATGGLTAGVAVSGLGQITSTLGEVYKASKSPAQSKGNTNAGDIITVSGQNDFHFYAMTIKKQYAKVIDGYFDMFGYKVNEVKVPNKNHRQNYWFTKTIDVSIDGAIPMEDMQKIKSCYNNGITFWKDPTNIGDYSVANNIV